MGDDRGNLPAGESDVLSWQVVDGPGPRVQGMVEGVLSTVAPVPALQRGRSLHRQHLLVNCLSATPQTHRELQPETNGHVFLGYWEINVLAEFEFVICTCPCMKSGMFS